MSDKPDFDPDRAAFRKGSADDSRSRGSFRAQPPVVPERVAVLKANYKQAWLYFLLGVCLLVAWGVPLRYALTRALSFRADETGPRTEQTFVAVSWEGISDTGEEVTPEQFADQIQLLKEAGYNAITLKDVNALYEEGTPLPEKAVLLTFDHSRKSSYFVARRVLQKVGWYGVMFVWTKPIEDEDPAALRWPYIRAMIRSGAWEAGAQSHAGFGRIPIDSEGTLGNFMVHPQWLESKARYETPAEFKDRLEADHQHVFGQVQEETGVAPVAYAFPYGDFGQYDERALLTRRLNMDLASSFYDLAFIHGTGALNTIHTDPYRLNRMLVDPEWTAEELVKRLEAAWPRDRGIDDRILSNRKAWQTEWGGFQLQDNTARIHATSETSGSKVWVNGTALYKDIRARFTLKPGRGQAGLYFRAAGDGESHLFLGLGEKGEVWLRQKTVGMEPFTLGTSRFMTEPDGSVDLDLTIRGNQIFVMNGGEPVFDELILARGNPRPGLVGMSVWNPEIGTASFEILDMDIRPFHNNILTWTPFADNRPRLAGWLETNGYRYTHLAPPWLELGSQGRAEQPGWDAVHFRKLANVYNLAFTPMVRIQRVDSTEPPLGENLAFRAAEVGADAVFCDFTPLRGSISITNITSWLQTFSEVLTAQGMDLIVALPPETQDEKTVMSLLQGLPNLTIAAQRNSLLFEDGLHFQNPRVATWNTQTFQETDFPLFMELTPGSVSPMSDQDPVHSRVLWELGLEEFDRGNLDQAAMHWKAWSRMEPNNPKPLRLLGDVAQRQGNIDEAVTLYRHSLEAHPGQIPLVVDTAMLLELGLNREGEAKEMLDLYRRLFPDNSEILLAQAAMMLRNGDQGQAQRLIQTVVEQNPDNLSALALLHKLLYSPTRRVANIDRILTVGRQVGMNTHFAKAIEQFGLLTWPESWRLIGFLRDQAESDLPEADLYQSLLPRQTIVREKFRTGNLSDNWIESGAEAEQEEGSFFLAAPPTETEAALILRQSETMQNGFIEAEVDDARGFFWLYARRSEGNMVRFGFETSGKLYIQVWKGGQVVSNQMRDWTPPAESATLRLVVRGQAAFTYIDGQPAFGAPTRIPEGMQLGWWGMAPWAPQFGVAQVEVRQVSGGPLPVHLGFFDPKRTNWTDEEMKDKIKPFSETLHAISPAWYFQDMNGDIRLDSDTDYKSFRILTRFYKIRLMPLIRSVSARSLDFDELINLAEEANVSGFVLAFSRLPEEEWFEDAEKRLVGTGLTMLAVRMNEFDQVAKVREIGSTANFLPGEHKVHPFKLYNLTNTGNEAEGIPPFLGGERPVTNPLPESESETEQADSNGGVEDASPSVEFVPHENAVLIF